MRGKYVDHLHHIGFTYVQVGIEIYKYYFYPLPFCTLLLLVFGSATSSFHLSTKGNHAIGLLPWWLVAADTHQAWSLVIALAVDGRGRNAKDGNRRQAGLR